MIAPAPSQFSFVMLCEFWRLIWRPTIWEDAHRPADGNIHAGREGEHVDDDRNLVQFRESFDAMAPPLAVDSKNIGMVPDILRQILISPGFHAILSQAHGNEIELMF